MHGTNNSEVATSISTPADVEIGITFAVGTAPVHKVSGKTNELVMCNSYAEAVTKLGYSDDWSKFTLCEVMYNHFKNYGIAPIIFVNVLNPSTHKEAVASAEVNYTDGKALLPETAINSSSLVVKLSSSGEALTKGTDYEVYYDGSNLVVAGKSGGAIESTATKLYIAYDKVDTTDVTASDISGSVDSTTNVKTGFELIEDCMAVCGVYPEFLIAPGWSHNPTVAASMVSKAGNIDDGNLKGLALIDVDTSSATNYNAAYTAKTTNNWNSKNAVICWPLLKSGDKTYHFSTQLAALMACVDISNGNVPSESPSNKSLVASAAVLASGTEIAITKKEANFLNGKGIVTALSMNGVFRAWGNYTACYPTNTDIKDYFIPVSRMFGYIERMFAVSFWEKVDRKLTRPLLDGIVDSINIIINGLVAEQHLLGGRVEFLSSENTLTDLMAGKACFHIYIAPPSPAQELHFKYEYSSEYVTEALSE